MTSSSDPCPRSAADDPSNAGEEGVPDWKGFMKEFPGELVPVVADPQMRPLCAPWSPYLCR